MRKYQGAFSGGTISKSMFGRIDLARVQGGLEECVNFNILLPGSIENRAGTKFVAETKDFPGNRSAKTRLIPFQFSQNDSCIVAVSQYAFHFYAYGQTIMDGAFPLEVVNYFTEDELFDAHYIQRHDVIDFVHPNRHPGALRRLAPDDWQFDLVAFNSTASPPTVNVTGILGGGQNIYTYCVTIVSDGVESAPSAVVSAMNDLSNPETANILTIQNHSQGTVNIYRGASAKSVGFLDSVDADGSGASIEYRDFGGIVPDGSITPPKYDAGKFDLNWKPGAITRWDQRVVFAGSNNDPFTCWLTRTGTENNMSYHVPPVADDAMSLKFASNSGGQIQHLLSLNNLIALTESNVYRVEQNGGMSAVDLPSIRSPSYAGASDVQPTIIDQNALFEEATSHHIYELGYDWESGGYTANDICFMCPHLFDGYSIVDMAFSKAPTPIQWCVRSDGKLVAMTYSPVQQIASWYVYETDGKFESCAVVTEEGRSVLYVVVNRIINGQERRYIEQFQDRLIVGDDVSDKCFLDSSLSFDGDIGGLPNLAPFVGATIGDIIINEDDAPYGYFSSQFPTSCFYDPETGKDAFDLNLTVVQADGSPLPAGMIMTKYPSRWISFTFSTNNIYDFPNEMGISVYAADDQGATSRQSFWVLRRGHRPTGVLPPDSQNPPDRQEITVTGSGDDLTVTSSLIPIFAGFVVSPTAKRLTANHNGEIFTFTITSVVDDMTAHATVDKTIPDDFAGNQMKVWKWAVQVVSGLDHLEGREVGIFADGAVQPRQIVVGGRITLTEPASKICVGLPYTSRAKTLPMTLALNDGSGAVGRAKEVGAIFLNLFKSRTVKTGTDPEDLRAPEARIDESFGVPPSLFDGEVEIYAPVESWNTSAQILIEQTDPLPLTVLSLSAEIEVGG